MLQTINKAFKLLLRLDPQASNLLLPLENKSLTVYIIDLDYTVSLKIKSGSIFTNNESSENILSGKLAYIIELIFNKNLQELLIAEKLSYQGSLKDLKEFNSFFAAIDIDFIYKISKLTNPEFANLVARPFEKAKQYLKTSRQETITDIKDYLTEEKKTLISKNEINVFYQQVQELKQSVDRIEAKLKLLQGLNND